MASFQTIAVPASMVGAREQWRRIQIETSLEDQTISTIYLNPFEVKIEKKGPRCTEVERSTKETPNHVSHLPPPLSIGAPALLIHGVH
ncbi:hypothetical protein MUK42_35407 [Musa troglodytarum]|uniref:Uncharacterized protein n=1 Tax=Musa troglodytarum TaxID=320322 RepID=A0A9E7GF27_9LILI|nr:hypothetical protein MUK42_35407 [Musa troglodytarum]